MVSKGDKGPLNEMGDQGGGGGGGGGGDSDTVNKDQSPLRLSRLAADAQRGLRSQQQSQPGSPDRTASPQSPTTPPSSLASQLTNTLPQHIPLHHQHTPYRHTHSTFSITKNEEFFFKVPQEAPVFVPTPDEFKNPLTYISKIRPVAEKFGICKIRPPPSWQPPFTVDVDKLRFVPRVQRLNELEAKTRVKLNFLDQIAKFWELQGSSLKIPMVERKALDLYSLYRLVQGEGGLEQVTKDRKWSRVAVRLGYPAGKNLGTILKGHYERILYPFDLYTSGKTEELTKQKLLSPKEDLDYKPTANRGGIETTTRRSQRTVQNYLVSSHQNGGTGSPTSPPCAPGAGGTATAAAAAAPVPGAAVPMPAAGVIGGAAGLAAALPIGIDEKFKDGPSDEEIKNAELRRLQIFGAGPKMAGFKTRHDQKGRMAFGGGARKSYANRKSCDPLAKYICHICNRGDIEEAMLLCDGCDDSYHTFCLVPPLENIPKGDWRCPKCVVEEVSKPIEAFGFEQAQREYTLQQFGEMADQFKADYFNIPVHLVPTELVEREFWRIVSSIDEDVTVEYGADLHTMDHGSGFPTKNSLYLLPGDQEYAESSWNLNNLPLLEESILGHINADISGMKVPWMYVGMCFATFCWHNEDHWSYSINYLHWGEPKTWYGVPGSSAEAFETTMKSTAPELFQSQPDLLHQLVTIMNPNILMNDGVPVYRTDQHAGEFVITFPRAYHAGFNQGYNFAEAVNFAPADWMKMGRECVNHYSLLRRFCVFSHDELVCKMALEPDRLNLGIATACYLDMAEMVDSEKKLRKSLLEWGVTKAEREAFELLPDDERQCDSCKTTCFLSAVTCTCNHKALVCLRHYSDLCKCPPDKHTLKYRYTLDELPLMLRKLKVKAESFENWLTKVRDVIDPNTPTTISLEELQELAQEAEDKKFPGSVLLERLNSAVLEAEKCVTVIQQLDINKMRTRTRNSADTAKYKLTMEELELFVLEIDNLCCVIQEGNSVRELQQLGKEFCDTAALLFKKQIPDIYPNDVERLIEDGSSLCIDLPQIKELKYLHEQVNWYTTVREIRESGEKIPLVTIKKLLNEGLNIVPHNILERELVDLQRIMYAVESWEQKAKHCFESGTQHEIPEIEDLLDRAERIEGNLPTHPVLKDALKKAKEWLSTVEILQTNENYPYFHTLENVVNRGKNIPFQLEELKRMDDHLNSARTWKQRTSKTFLKKSSQFTLMEALCPRFESIMLPHRAKAYLTDEQLIKQFTEDMGPVQMVVSFKNAEEKEMHEIRELRKVNGLKNPEEDKYCMCRRRFHGTMYHCELCQDWFHSSCVPMPRNTVRPRPANATLPTNSIVFPPLFTHQERAGRTKYLCPSCMRSRRPRLETILSLLVSLQRLPIRLPEGEALQCLTERAMNWQDRARQALAMEDVVQALASLSHLSQKLSPADILAPSSSVKDKTAERMRELSKIKRRPVATTLTTAAAAAAAAEATTSAAATSTTNSSSSSATSRQLSDSSETDTENEEDISVLSNISINVNDDVSIGDSNPSPLSFNPSKHNDEHAYSIPPPFTKSPGCSGSSMKSDTSLIFLKKSTKDYLEELMMEGDLLEVSLDETHHLWRILNAAKNNTSDLSYMHCKYKSHSSENLVKNIRKRGSDDPNHSTKKTKSALVQDHSNAIGVGAAAAAALPTTSAIIPANIGHSGSVSQSSIGAGSIQAPTTTTPTMAVAAAAAAATTLTPRKRGRKMKIVTRNDDTSASGGGSGVVSGGGGGGDDVVKVKKKRGRKSAQELAAATASTSEEEEDCSAALCVRPTGREVDWVQCDGGCNQWFHMFCVGLVKTQIKPDDDFICKKCKKQNTINVDMSPAAAASSSSSSATPTKMDIDATTADMTKDTPGTSEEAQATSETTPTTNTRKTNARKCIAGGSSSAGASTTKATLKPDTAKDVDVESSEKEAEAKEVKTKFPLSKSHQCISPTTSSSKSIVTTKAADSSTNPNKEDDDDDTQDSVDGGVVGFDALGSPVQNRGSEQVTTTSVFQSTSDIDIRKRIEDLRRLQ